MEKKNKEPIYKKIWFWIAIIIVIILINFIPKEPTIPKPDDFLYCETDDDCTITGIDINSSCTHCGKAVNKEGKVFLDEWYKLNCHKMIYSYICSQYDCIPIKPKCENNMCTTFELGEG